MPPMTKPRLLDAFCGAGGCAMGYSLAGFDVVGVDNRPQPHFPFAFVQADALEYIAAHGHEYDVISASPPCQGYSKTEPMKRAIRLVKEYPMLVEEVRAALRATGKPFVIENVPGAPLHNPLMLCGTMFGLGVIRHRLFEINPPAYFAPGPCAHQFRTARRGEYDRGQGGYVTVAGNNFVREVAARAMGIDWMTQGELAQAIPPAFTRWIGEHLLTAVLI